MDRSSHWEQLLWACRIRDHLEKVLEPVVSGSGPFLAWFFDVFPDGGGPFSLLRLKVFPHDRREAVRPRAENDHPDCSAAPRILGGANPSVPEELTGLFAGATGYARSPIERACQSRYPGNWGRYSAFQGLSLLRGRQTR